MVNSVYLSLWQIILANCPPLKAGWHLGWRWVSAFCFCSAWKLCEAERFFNLIRHIRCLTWCSPALTRARSIICEGLYRITTVKQPEYLTKPAVFKYCMGDIATWVCFFNFFLIKVFPPYSSKPSEWSSNPQEYKGMNSLGCAVFTERTVAGYRFNLMAIPQMKYFFSCSLWQDLSQASRIPCIASAVLHGIGPGNSFMAFFTCFQMRRVK